MSVRTRVSLGAIKQLATHPTQLVRLPGYLRDLWRYQSESRHASSVRLYPCLGDRQPTQPALGHYFFQDTWAARQVFRARPEWLVDIGSTVLLVGILSQFRPCVSVDIRPIDTRLEGLSTRRGSATELPFSDGEVPCLTTMCVLEHVGLGRYGDVIDPLGTEKAVAEIQRVLRPKGLVIYSVPIGRDLIEFNANRRFTPRQAKALFAGWQLVDACLLSPTPVPLPPDDAELDSLEAVGCFAFRKP
jgi:hypothetical protein